MGKTLLILAFGSAGLNFVAMRIGNVFGIESALFVNVVLCVPAAALGTASWLMTRSFARAVPVVLCVAIAWIGMLYAFEIEKNRGTLAISYLAMALPIGALVVQHRCWWLCAKVYVIANAIALAVALWFEYQAFGAHIAGSSFRFGWLWSADGVRRSNPNIVGGQLAFAALLALMLYMRKDASPVLTPSSDVAGRIDGDNTRRFSLGWTFFLTIGMLLTASRGAFLAWGAGLGTVWFWGSRSTDSGTLKNLVAVSAALVLVMLFVSVAVDFAPWETLQGRIGSMAQTLESPTGRMMLWRNAAGAWYSDPQYFLIGTGTGVAPEVLGEYCGYVWEDGVTVAAADAHNAFVEWGLSFGLIGMVAGISMMLTVWRRAFVLDRCHGGVNRRAVLLCFCLISMYYVTYYQLLFVAAGALILAMLSEPPADDALTESARRSERSDQDNNDDTPSDPPRVAGRRSRRFASSRCMHRFEAAFGSGAAGQPPNVVTEGRL